MFKITLKKILIGLFAIMFLSLVGVYFVYTSVKNSLPEIIKVEDYKPLLASQVFDRNGKKVGEFFRERRILIPYNEIPEHVVQAFISAEDDQFFQHKGINIQALFRAAIANMRAGRNVQGGSTITQQVAKTLLLTNERTFSRKLRDILLALQMEKNLSKKDIMYLYLNQIYFGQSAYGIEMAAQTYFRKSARKLTVAEAAMLAGLPKAPSEYSPVRNPSRAKERQNYVLHRMAENKFITAAQKEEFTKAPITVFVKEPFEEMAPYYMETIRQLLVEQLGEDIILNQGVKITASLDLENQKAANKAVVKGLKELDKRQGFRGPLKTFEEDEIEDFLVKEKKKIISDQTPERTILEDGTFKEVVDLKADKKIGARPAFLNLTETYKAIVSEVNDKDKYVIVQLPDAKGLIDFETMKWARKPDTDVKSDRAEINKPSQALKKGDEVLVKIISDQAKFTVPVDPNAKKPIKKPAKSVEGLNLAEYVGVELDQEPLLEGSLLSFDQTTQDVLAMVGGYSFARNEYNRALQAARQTGSAFKALVYAAALEKGYNPSTRIIDAPIVYKQNQVDEEGQGDEKIWSPSNHGHGYSGEITMRNALIKSLNIPSVKIVEDIGVNYSIEFARRLGVFSKLNPDFTLVLGSSSLTLYEMTKAFSEFGRNGLRTRPMIVKKVVDRSGKVLLENLSLESRYLKETQEIDKEFEEKRQKYLAEEKAREEKNSNTASENEIDPSMGSPFYFENPEQLIKPEVAYVITQMLKGVVTDPGGTGGRAAQIGREVAGKTGTTNGYVDGWFIGYTPNVATGVWVGFDRERSIGKGEVGGRTALPIWIDFMKQVHEKLPVLSFTEPKNIKTVKIDSETGMLASSSTVRTVEQAYIEGTEPTAAAAKTEETNEYLKEDLGE